MLLWWMPSAGSVIPSTLETEMGELQERITSTRQGRVTSIQAIYVPRTTDGPGAGVGSPT